MKIPETRDGFSALFTEPPEGLSDVFSTVRKEGSGVYSFGNHSISIQGTDGKLKMSDGPYKLHTQVGDNGELSILVNERNRERSGEIVIHPVFSNSNILHPLFAYHGEHHTINSVALEFPRDNMANGSEQVPYFDVYDSVQGTYYEHEGQFKPGEHYDQQLQGVNFWGKSALEGLGFNSLHLEALSLESARIVFKREESATVV